MGYLPDSKFENSPLPEEWLRIWLIVECISPLYVFLTISLSFCNDEIILNRSKTALYIPEQHMLTLNGKNEMMDFSVKSHMAGTT